MAEFNGKQGYWITVNGNHIFVEKGKTLSQAFTDFLMNATDSKYSLNDYTEDLRYLHNIEKHGEYTFNILNKTRKTIEADSLLEAMSQLDDKDEVSSFNLDGKTHSFNIGHNINPRKVSDIRRDVLLGKIK